MFSSCQFLSIGAQFAFGPYTEVIVGYVIFNFADGTDVAVAIQGIDVVRMCIADIEFHVFKPVETGIPLT